MTEKELRRLGRGDLLNLLLEQSRENQRLREQLQAAQDALADKAICINQAGSIAEASLQLNGVFQAAERACQQYTENIVRLSQHQQVICAQREKESQEKALQIVADAQKQAEDATTAAQKQCDEMLKKQRQSLRHIGTLCRQRLLRLQMSMQSCVSYSRRYPLERKTNSYETE